MPTNRVGGRSATNTPTAQVVDARPDNHHEARLHAVKVPPSRPFVNVSRTDANHHRWTHGRLRTDGYDVAVWLIFTATAAAMILAACALVWLVA